MQTLWKVLLVVFCEINSIYDLAIVLLGTYSRQIFTQVQKNEMRILTTVVFMATRGEVEASKLFITIKMDKSNAVESNYRYTHRVTKKKKKNLEPVAFTCINKKHT